MSIRQSLLALLAEGDTHGYALRQEFEQRTGGTWPLNIGQVYTTLNRLHRDGLVDEAGRQDDGTVIYRITTAGREAVTAWWHTPVDRSTPMRDEAAIKLAMAVTAPDVDVRGLIQAQREEVVTALQAHTRAKQAVPQPPSRADLARLLILDQLIFAAEAETRWLDHCEQRLTQLDRPKTSAPRRPGGKAR